MGVRSKKYGGGDGEVVGEKVWHAIVMLECPELGPDMLQLDGVKAETEW